jgi:hypothetical protein
VTEVVEEDLQRRVRDLELSGRELEPERGLVPGDEVLLVGHAVLLASRVHRRLYARAPAPATAC